MKEEIQVATQCNSHEQAGVTSSSTACDINHSIPANYEDYEYNDHIYINDGYDKKKKILLISLISTLAVAIASLIVWLLAKKEETALDKIHRAKKELIKNLKKADIIEKVKDNASDFSDKVTNTTTYQKLTDNCVIDKIKKLFS